jgi:hypothetical protein
MREGPTYCLLWFVEGDNFEKDVLMEFTTLGNNLDETKKSQYFAGFVDRLLAI